MTIRADLGRWKGERGWLVLGALPPLDCGYLWTIPVCRQEVSRERWTAEAIFRHRRRPRLSDAD